MSTQISAAHEAVYPKYALPVHPPAFHSYIITHSHIRTRLGTWTAAYTKSVEVAQ